MRSLVRFILAVSFLLCLFGVALYFIRFHFGLSDDDQSWSNFATYVGLFVNILTLTLIGCISFLTFRTTERVSATTERVNRLQSNPILDFTVENVQGFEKIGVTDSWFIMNGSNAAARNVILRFWLDGHKQSRNIQCFSVVGNGKVEVPWLRFATRIELYYSDLLRENFFVLRYENMRGQIQALSTNEFDQVFNERYMNVAEIELRFRNFARISSEILSAPLYYKEFLVSNDMI